ncbi:MAG: ABC transporter permease subunit [Variibacter sp.]
MRDRGGGSGWLARARGATWIWFLAPVVLYLVLLMVLPVGRLLLLAITTRDGTLTIDNFARAFQVPVYLKVFWITLKLAAMTTVLSLIFSYPVAYLASIARASTRVWIVFLILLPFWTSFLVRTFAWLVLLGKNGTINSLLRALGIIDAPANLMFNFTAVLVVMCHAMMSLCVLTMLSVMENIDRNLQRAATTLGAPPGSAFWQVYFPLSLPGVSASALLVFISALGFFITPAFIGGRQETVITQVIIEQVLELLNWPFAAALSIMLLAISLVIFYVFDRLVGISALSGGAGQTGLAESAQRALPRRGEYGRKVLALIGRISDVFVAPLQRRAHHRGGETRRFGVLSIVCAAVLAFLVLPPFVMVPLSFTETSFIDWPPRGFSMRWYVTFFSSPEWMAATYRSFVIGLFSALLAMVIGVPAAFVLARRQFAGKVGLISLILSPLIIPRIIIALALFYLFARLNIAGTILSLVLGHAVISVPFVVVTVMATLKNFDQRLEHAAWSLGARPWRTFLHVTFPIIRSGLLAAFLFAFITSFDELTIALFVTGGVTSTLPKQMWDAAILQITPTLAAASTFLLVVVMVAIGATEWLRRRTAA